MVESASSILDRFRLDVRQAVVTGAAHGIGRATAAALAQAGASVWLSDIDGPAVAEAAAELAAGGLRPSARMLDVTDDAAARRIVDDIVAATGRLDILVNNAGIGGRAPSVTYEGELWERVVAVNLTGCFLMGRTAARVMLPRQSGCIVIVASIMGRVGNGLYPNPAYHATKAHSSTLLGRWRSNGRRSACASMPWPPASLRLR